MASINDVIKMYGLTNIKLLGKAKESVELRYGIRKDWPKLQESINQMINTMPKEKINSILNKWISIKNEKKIDYTLIWEIILVFLIILLFIIYWNRKLTKEINHRKIVEAKLIEAQKKAENANKAKSEFLSNMSHEIRTPMNAIIGFAELTSKMNLPSKALNNVNIIKKSAKALIDIINDILDLSKIEAGKLSIQKKPTNIKNIADDLYAIFSLRAKNKDIFLDISFGKNVQKALIVDEIRIRQILINLIGNALKFTHQGSVKVKFMTIFNNNEKDLIDLHVEIKDTGIGIKDEDKEKVFGVFEQQSSQDNKTYGGTGLGLSISQKLANLMGGKIELKSFQNEGSTFTLIIPNIEVATSLPSINSNNTPTILFDKASVLIVDDIEENLNLLKNILEQYKFDIIKTNSGSKAIQLAEEKLPDIILMDIKMPHVDGYQASNAIKKNNITSNIPIIAVSASVLGEVDLKRDKKYFDDFIPKPIDIQELENTMAKYLTHVINNEQNNIKSEVEEKSKLTFKKEDRVTLLNLAKKLLDTGDLTQAKEIANILQKQSSNEYIVVKINSAVDNLDIDIIEKECFNIITTIEKGNYHEL
ncbi:ATP-binding protein [Sulfurospirillum sp. 1307]